MPRQRNTDRNGNQFSEQTKLAVWNKAQVVNGIDPNKKRKDRCNAWIEWNQYGITVENGTGWEIDHNMPVAKGGSDDISNLQPLQWENNRHKSDDYPNWSCLISARQ